MPRRRTLWPALVLVLVAASVSVAPSVASQLGGKPVNPAPGAHLSVVWPKGRPLRVLFVGDSLTVGKYAVRRGNAFPALVTAALRARGRVTESVRARTGVKTSYWASRQLPAADLVVLELGTNDFSVHLTPPATFESDYARLVANVRARLPHAQLLCLSLWRSSRYGYEGESLLTYNKAVAHECRGGAFVWISALYDAKGARGPAGVPTFQGRSDSLHPNDVGHRGIARAIEQTLRLG